MADIKEQMYPDIDLLKIILKDKSTGLFIRWATNNYESYGSSYKAEQQIFPELIAGDNIEIVKPRVKKDLVNQQRRTRDKAEVFTPSWICNQQNNLIDEAWFGRRDVFNAISGNEWITNNALTK